MNNIVINLRAVDRKRLNNLQERTTSPLVSEDIWYIHTVLAQCFLPYRDPKASHWKRQNGKYSIILSAGAISDPHDANGVIEVGLPYGAKPRLFQSYICTQVIKQQSPVIPVERSMTAMMRELGFEPKGGPRGTIASFKDQITRFARCSFTVVAPGPRGTQSYITTPPIKKFDVWFPPDPNQGTLWPSEIVLTDEYYYSLKDHAVPFDFRALKAIQNNARAQDIYLWMTQRLCRVDEKKPLYMRWKELHEMFGGRLKGLRRFKETFRNDLTAARVAYPDAKMEEYEDGFIFRASAPPVPKTKIVIK
jgi:hypothetical protein